MENTASRRGLVGPILLIALGVVFLLSTLGVIQMSIWQLILRLWPLLIIAAGIDFLLGHRPAWGLLITVFIVLMVICVVAWSAEQWPLHGGRWYESGWHATTAQTMTQPAEGATEGEVEINAGAGRLVIGALKASPSIMEGTFRGSIERSFHVSGKTAYLNLRATRFRGDQDWRLNLNEAMPLRLRLETGVGTATLNLEEINLTDLDLNTGVGQTVLTLPASNQYKARVHAGIGEVRIYLPKNLGARIKIDQGLGAIHVPDGFTLVGGAYVSPDFDRAQAAVELEIHGGIGRIDLETL